MAQLNFNEQFYLSQNPDIAAAISRGQFTNAQQHFNLFGRFEGRDPNAFFDTSFYLSQYPDVANARVNPLDHFLQFGAREGRFTNANADSVIDTDGNNLANEFNATAYLAANADVKAAVDAGKTTALQHFQLFGQFEGRPGTQLNNGTVLTGPFATGGTGGGANPGQTFTLTAAAAGIGTGIDTLTGTDGNDIFRAITTNSLSSVDTINGGAGQDVLNISAGAIAGGNAAPVISSVERINNASDGATLDLAQVTGVQQIWSSDTNTYTNALTSTVFGAEKMTGTETVNVAYTGTATTASVAIANTDAAGDVTFDFGGNAATIKSVSVAASTGNAGDVTLDADLNALETITVTGAGRVTVVSTEATLKTFDASANTGGVTYTSGDVTSDLTVKGGSGSDVFTFSANTGSEKITVDAGAGNDIIVGGAGNDTINGGAGNDIITGGAGADTLTGGAGNDIFRYTATSESTGTTIAAIDTITDFTRGDVIDLSAITDVDSVAAGDQRFALTSAANQIAVTNAVDALAPGSTFTQALDAATTALTDGAVGTFRFGGDTYVVGDGVGTVADLVIRLTGTVELTASDFTFA